MARPKKIPAPKSTATEKGKKNLMHIEDYKKTISKEQAKENARKGGINSQKKRKEAKTYREIFEAINNMKAPSSIEQKLKEMYPDCPDDMKLIHAQTFAVLNRALKGDISAFCTIRDSVGQKPIDKQAQVNPDGSPIVNELVVRIEFVKSETPK